MSSKRKKSIKAKPVVILNRKQRRKQERKLKKVRRNEYYTNRNKPGKFVRNPDYSSKKSHELTETKLEEKIKPIKNTNKVLTVEQQCIKEKKQQRNLEKEMSKQRSKQLIDANLEEDRTIKQLEKQLKLDKRKTKNVPKTFVEDGLDYLLEVCDPETMHSAIATEQQLHLSGNEFEEDLALMLGKNHTKQNKSETTDEFFVKNSKRNGAINENDNKRRKINKESDVESEIENDSVCSGSEEDIEADLEENESEMENNELEEDENASEVEENASGEDEMEEENVEANKSEAHEEQNSGIWEDIYGRLRGKDGSILNKCTEKYIPPALRMQTEQNLDEKQLEKLNKLRKHLKGLLNRLAESNMHTITREIENLYMNNSRNDMNETVTKLIEESLITAILAPERLLIEHVMLITILHANIGTEIGAHFLQKMAKKFNDRMDLNNNIEDKSLDNIVIILAQLYNFKLFDSKLIYEILEKLANKFKEKDIECILHILKNVGFNLRKDNPLALKDFILKVQKQASNYDKNGDNARLKFMLDILLAIKNNNMSKIPNYDTSYAEHLKKILKSYIRQGNYVTQLNISLQDLLNVEEKGRWWIVGSAWTGKDEDKVVEKKNCDSFSQKLLDLAKKQRMNTDTRRDIFCIIMSAEDYLDAFEKLLRLGLKNQQEREIVHVLLHCCLHETSYNRYYEVLMQKFCEYDRRFQMIIKYAVWDKLKILKNQSTRHLSHLSKLLTHLFLERGLPISILKIIQFSELDKILLRFMRQILLGILLHDDLETMQNVFTTVALSDKLKMFRESLRLFIHHFLLKNLKVEGIPNEQKELLETRAKIVERLLMTKEKFR